VGGTGGVRTGGTSGVGVGGTGGVRTGGTGGGGVGGTGGVRTGGASGVGVGGTGGVRTGGTGGGGVGGTGGVRDGGLDGGDARRDSPGDRPSDVVCGTREICDNGIDDDCNGLADCFDSACRDLPACIDRKKEICNNGIDDDGNSLIDCKDPACFGDPACFVRGHEICNNGLDDDDDGLVDCNDPDCAKDPTCVVNPVNEICDNGIDDNKDGLVDCADPQCKSFPACLRAACTPDVDFGAIAGSGASVTRTMSTVGATTSYGTCAPPGGVGRVGSFSLAASADVKLDFSQGSSSAHVVAVFRAGWGRPATRTGRLLARRPGRHPPRTPSMGSPRATTGSWCSRSPGPRDRPPSPCRPAGPLQPRSATTGSTTMAMAPSTARIWTVPAPPTAGRASLTSTSRHRGG